MMKRNYLLIGLLLLFVLAACGGSGDGATAVEQPVNTAQSAESMNQNAEMADDDDMSMTATDEMADDDMAMAETEMKEDAAAMEMKEDDASMEMHEGEDDMASDEMKEDTMMDDTMADLPAWQKLPLVNARTGETFTLADFSGKAVFVETMATWCSNCRRQLTNVREAIGQVAGDQAVFVALSVETNMDAATLAAYANDEGFDWLFAVATPELLTELAGQFGQSITNPPSTPHFVIRPDGSVTELTTGIKSTADVVAQVQATLTQ